MFITSLCNAFCGSKKEPVPPDKALPKQERFHENATHTNQLALAKLPIDSKNTNIELLHAIKRHDLAGVIKIINSGVNVNFIYNENTPLTYAISLQEDISKEYLFKSESIIRTLLEAKASPHTCLPLLNAMQIRCEQRVIQTMGWLLEASISWPDSSFDRVLEQRDQYGQTPLIWAIAQKHINVVGYLLQSRAQVNGCDHNQNTPLIHAVRLQSPPQIVSHLLNARADIHACMTRGKSALFYAKRHKNSALYYQLISLGAQETAPMKSLTEILPTEIGENTLMCAIEDDNLSAVENLLQFGVSVNCADKKRNTALVRAIKHHPVALKKGQEKINAAIITTLLKAKANPNLGTALICAIRLSPESASFSITKQLLEASQSLEPMLGKLCLLSRNDKAGKTALIWAVSQAYVQSTFLLLQSCADVNAPDYKGNTPLLYAAKMQHGPLLSLLIQAGANSSRCNIYGETVFDAASRTSKLKFKKESCLEETLKIDQEVYSAEVNQIAKNLFDSSQTDPNKVRGYFLKWILLDAIEEALTQTKKPEEAAILAKTCLLNIIEKTYASVTEFLTDTQIEEVVEQQARLKNNVMTPENYDYAEYDQDTLQAALTAYFMNQRATLAPEFEQPYQYPVVRHRMPGQNTTDADYRRLYYAATQIEPSILLSAVKKKLLEMEQKV